MATPLRDVLVITLGETPPVVTETVWALLSRPEPFVPAAIHLVTTQRGRKQCQQQLTGPGGQLAQLFAHFGHAPVEPAIHLPVDQHGEEMHDIRTEAENIAFANTLTTLVRQITDNPATRLHVSLAGGRKTMSAYAASAISLFGRDGDELSHVLVEPATFERCRDFYWPAQALTHVTTHEGEIVESQQARILLVRSPFVRLRHLLPASAFPGGDIDYGAIVETAQARLDARRVVVRVEQRTIEAGQATLRLGHLEFAMFHLLAVARKDDWPGAGPDGLGPQHHGWLSYEALLTPGARAGACFLEFYEDAFTRESRQSDDFSAMFAAAIASRQGDRLEELKARFSQIKSKAARSLERAIADPVLRRAAGISTVKRGGVSRFGLLIDGADIDIVPRP